MCHAPIESDEQQFAPFDERKDKNIFAALALRYSQSPCSPVPFVPVAKATCGFVRSPG